MLGRRQGRDGAEQRPALGQRRRTVVDSHPQAPLVLRHCEACEVAVPCPRAEKATAMDVDRLAMGSTRISPSSWLGLIIASRVTRAPTLRWRPPAADTPTVRTRKATVSAPPAPSPPDEGYLSLTIAEVLADLSSLDSEQLLMVKGLEEAGERRTVILDRIGDLLVVQEAAQHMRVVQRSPLLSHRPHPL